MGCEGEDTGEHRNKLVQSNLRNGSLAILSKKTFIKLRTVTMTLISFAI